MCLNGIQDESLCDEFAVKDGACDDTAMGVVVGIDGVVGTSRGVCAREGGKGDGHGSCFKKGDRVYGGH